MNELDELEEKLMKEIERLSDINESKKKRLSIGYSRTTKEYYIKMPININSLISQQVNSKEECIKIGFKFFKEGFSLLLNSIKYYFQFDKLKEEIIKKDVIKRLK